MKKNEVAVLIPIYKSKLNVFEKISLERCKNVLGEYTVIFLAPNSLKFNYGKDYELFKIERFMDIYFHDTTSYNCLMLSKEFYERFFLYKYILIYQLDAFVFSNRLIEFCEMKYDYIGASHEYIHGDYWFDGKRYQNIVGNGGFSLRNVKSCYNALLKFYNCFEMWTDNEDSFFSWCGNEFLADDFKVAPREVAQRFSYEYFAEDLYNQSDKKLPFGCHAWMKSDVEFYIDAFRKFGIDLSPYKSKMEDCYLFNQMSLKNYFEKRAFLSRIHYIDLVKDEFASERCSVLGFGRYETPIIDKMLRDGIEIDAIYTEHIIFFGKTYKGIPILSSKDLDREKKIICVHYDDNVKIVELERCGMRYGDNFISVHAEYKKKSKIGKWINSGYEEVKYVFPFHMFSPRSIVVLYGNGIIAREFYKQAKSTSYLNVIGIVDEDTNFIDSKTSVFPVYDSSFLFSTLYDAILITYEDEEIANNAKKALVSKGIDVDVIKWGGETYNLNNFYSKLYFNLLGKYIYHDNDCLNEKTRQVTYSKDKEKSGMAYEFNVISIAFMNYASGLGDAIISKKVYELLVEAGAPCKVDIYAVNYANILFGNVFYRNEETLNRVVSSDVGIPYYKKNCKKYDLAIRVWHRIEVDYVKHERLNYKLSMIVKKIQDYNEKHKKYCKYNELVKYNIEMAHRYGRTRYTCLSCDGALPINDYHVRIEVLELYKNEFEKLHLDKYITFNIGSGDDAQRKQLKEWPREYYEEFIQIVKREYKNIKVVQIGSKEQETLNGCDVSLLGRNLELVKYVLKKSIIHIDCEGGLVHLATQLGTRCAVIFGPTDVKYYGYENNINITSSECKPCIGKWKDRYTCLRGYDVPPLCMRLITPEIVFSKCKNHIENYL